MDNKLKTLFDALKAPKHKEEHPSGPALEDENPFYVVMEDDQFIDEITISTGRLLTPALRNQEERPDDVIVVLDIQTSVYDIDNADWWQTCDR